MPAARGKQGGDAVDFVAVVDQAIALLRQRGRLTYRTLQLQFQLEDAHLAALTDELIEGQRLAVDEAGRVLVWVGDTAARASTPAAVQALPPRRPPRRRTQNAGSSQSSSVIWWTRPPCPASSTRKTCARWSGPIKTPAPG